VHDVPQHQDCERDVSKQQIMAEVFTLIWMRDESALHDLFQRIRNLAMGSELEEEMLSACDRLEKDAAICFELLRQADKERQQPSMN
jgi:hypothetical protein